MAALEVLAMAWRETAQQRFECGTTEDASDRLTTPSGAR